MNILLVRLRCHRYLRHQMKKKNGDIESDPSRSLTCYPANHTGNGSKDDQTGKKPGQLVASKVGRFRFSAA